MEEGRVGPGEGHGHGVGTGMGEVVRRELLQGRGQGSGGSQGFGGEAVGLVFVESREVIEEEGE